MEAAEGIPSASSSLNSNAIHKPLDPLLPEIRVIKLLASASFDEPLECRLVHRPLYSESPGYEALSYVWGEPNFISEIKLNNEQYFITPNLDLAMRYLRRPSVERTLWVDALCINQHDLVERSQQVLLMKDIYARCTIDLAWLPTRGDTDLIWRRIAKIHKAFEFMKRISFKDAETLAKMSDWPSRLRIEPMKEISFEEAEALAKMPDGPSSGHSESTVDRSYLRNGPFLLNLEERMAFYVAFGDTGIWSRIWTIQELACAPQVKLVAGPRELDWAVVTAFLGDRPYADAFHAIFGHNGGAKALDLYFSGIVRMYDQRHALSDRDYRSNLLDTLARFQQNRASDPRDCVYGILGLVTDRHGIVVDYTKSTKQVFVDAVLSITNASQDLDILCQTTWMTRSRSENPHELPSWVPDFSSSVDSDAHMAILFAQRGIYAAGRAFLNAPCQPIDNQFLSIKVAILGCLQGEEIMQPNRQIHTSVEGFRTWQSHEAPEMRPRESLWLAFGAPVVWLQTTGVDIDILSDKSQYMRTGETAMRAYWRTLFMDCGAYPIRRLTAQDILQTDLAFKNILEFLMEKLDSAALKQAREKPIDRKQLNKNFFMSGGDEVANETLLGLWESMPRQASTMWCRNYRCWMFSVTDNGLYTMVRNSRAGDVIASVEGAKVPLVLREQGNRNGFKTYSLVGTAYVHGYMDGEALDLVAKGALHEEEILLQ